MKQLILSLVLCLTALGQNYSPSPAGITISTGGTISGVSETSRWHAAGLRGGDRIVTAFGYEISDEADVQSLYDYYQSNQEIPLKVKRADRELEIKIPASADKSSGCRRIVSYRHGKYETMVDMNAPPTDKPLPLILLEK